MRSLLKTLICTTACFTFFACDPIESGERPTFTGTAKAEVLGAKQATISWQAGSDDLVDSDELRYGIWFAKSSDGIKADENPQILTNKGALSYNLLELEANTQYDVLVRTRDLGVQYSDNTQTSSFTTSMANAGRFRDPVVIDLTFQASGIVAGFISRETRLDLGLIDGTRIRFHEAGQNGLSTESSFTLNVGQNVREAYLVPSVERFSSDLFVVTDSELRFYRQASDGFNRVTWSVEEVVAANSFSYHLNNNGILAAFSYQRDGRTGVLYSNDAAQQDVNDTFVSRGTISLANENDRFYLTQLDDDAFIDWVEFGSQGIRVALGSDEDYNFETPQNVDANRTRNATDDSFIISDADNDGDVDLYIYERNTRRAKSELSFYKSNGNGTFQSASKSDYKGAYYANPFFAQANSNNNMELVFIHTAANNIAVFNDTAGSFTRVTDYFGAVEKVNHATWGPFDASDGQDLVLVGDSKITLLRAIP